MPGRAKKENENGLVLFWQWVQKAKAKQHKQCAHKKSIFNRGEIMNYVEAIIDSDTVEIIGFHCDVCFSQVQQIQADFEGSDIDGFIKDGVYILKVIHHAAEYLNGGLTNGSWNDFKVIDYEEFERKFTKQAYMV
jgi:hypothetical protein